MTPEPLRASTVDGMAEPVVRRTLPLWLTVVLGLAGAAVALWGMRAAAPLLGPVALAFVLTVVVHPLIGALVRHGVRRGLAVAVAVLVVDGGLIAFAVALALSVGQLATVLPQYAAEWQRLLDGLKSTLAGAGISRAQVEQALQSIGPQPVIAALGRVVKGLAGSALGLVLVLATALFMIAESTGLPERLAAVPGTGAMRTALGGFATNTRRYIVVTTIFGFAVAVVDTIALVILGIPLPLLWGMLSFLTNYVPNIGFFLGLLPPTLLALLVGGPKTALLVVVIYSLANFLLQSVLQPVFVGDAVGLSVTLTFLSVVAWTVVLGAPGAVLAVPLTLLFQAILVVQDPDRRWARILLAGASGAGAGDAGTAGAGTAGASRRPRTARRRGGAGRREPTAAGVPQPRPVPAAEQEAAPVSSGQDDAPAAP